MRAIIYNNTLIHNNILKISITYLMLLVCSFNVQASEDHEDKKTSHQAEKSKSVDAISHIQDSHEWHFATEVNGEHWTVPLPIITYTSDRGLEVFMSSAFHHGDEIEEHGHTYYIYNGYKVDGHYIKLRLTEEREEAGVFLLDLSITKNVASMLLCITILFIVFFSVKTGYKKNKGKAPKGIQSFFEPLIIFVRDDIAKGNIGHKYEKFLPYLLTLFFFIWFNNVLGLLPGAANVTGNIAITGTLAFFTAVLTVYNGNKVFWGHLLDPLGNSMPWIGKLLLYPVLVTIELLGIIIKPTSLMIRLFANISAGHIIILSILGLTFIAEGALGYMIGGVSVLFASAMMMLELFVAILQAYIFTMLTAMYIGQAVDEGHH